MTDAIVEHAPHDTEQHTLSEALGTLGRELVAFVGGGGKTTALQHFSVEQARKGRRIAATTTTLMFARQLTSLGPLVLTEGEQGPFMMRLNETIRHNRVVGVARSVGADGKARGLKSAAVDALWRADLADFLVVEADGSHGLPLKAFGSAEPQLPQESTTVVVVAGLDVLGCPCDEAHVQRAELLRSTLGVTSEDAVTPQLLGAALALQVARVRVSVSRSRVVVLLNKADTGELAAIGTTAGDHLSEWPAPSGRPDRVVVASLRRGAFRVVHQRQV